MEDLLLNVYPVSLRLAQGVVALCQIESRKSLSFKPEGSLIYIPAISLAFRTRSAPNASKILDILVDV
jgi:hypothetical protein